MIRLRLSAVVHPVSRRSAWRTCSMRFQDLPTASGILGCCQKGQGLSHGAAYRYQASFPWNIYRRLNRRSWWHCWPKSRSFPSSLLPDSSSVSWWYCGWIAIRFPLTCIAEKVRSPWPCVTYPQSWYRRNGVFPSPCSGNVRCFRMRYVRGWVTCPWWDHPPNRTRIRHSCARRTGRWFPWSSSLIYRFPDRRRYRHSAAAYGWPAARRRFQSGSRKPILPGLTRKCYHRIGHDAGWNKAESWWQAACTLRIEWEIQIGYTTLITGWIRQPAWMP